MMMSTPVACQTPVSSLKLASRYACMQESALEDVGNLSWGAFKPVLADAVIAHLAPLQQQYAAVMSDPAYLDEVHLLSYITNSSALKRG